MSYQKHNTKEEKRERESEKKGGRGEEKKRRNACTFLSLDVLLKFVRHLSPPFPSLMIPAEPLWGMASVVRLAFTFPAPGILGYASGDYEAHHSKSSCGSFSLSLTSSPLSNRLHSSPLSCCCCTSAYADILCLTLVLSLSFFLPPFLFLSYFLIW